MNEEREQEEYNGTENISKKGEKITDAVKEDVRVKTFFLKSTLKDKRTLLWLWYDLINSSVLLCAPQQMKWWKISKNRTEPKL